MNVATVPVNAAPSMAATPVLVIVMAPTPTGRMLTAVPLLPLLSETVERDSVETAGSRSKCEIRQNK